MDKTNTQIYNGEIVAGSLLIPESRHIAKLLIANADDDAWHQAIVIDNVLQKRSPAAAKRQAKLIKNRLSLMQPALWEMIDQGSNDVATQAILAAAIKHSRLLGDFMDQVIQSHWKTFITKISTTDWNSFLETCIQKDPVIDTWMDSTRAKLKQVVFRILAESKYVDGTRTLALLPVSIVPEV
ncbi:MAG: DUF1819 family protein, partial [Desulfobacteraceae bacterium]|nr:DUF1819 family protein [Desulfobacteraceae bacterium]